MNLIPEVGQRAFPIEVVDQATGKKRRVISTSAAFDQGRQLRVLFDANGKAYVPASTSAITHVPAPEYDRATEPEAEATEWIQVVDGRGDADLIEVKPAGREDEDGRTIYTDVRTGHTYARSLDGKRWVRL
jgi:hypothetical protein